MKSFLIEGVKSFVAANLSTQWANKFVTEFVTELAVVDVDG
jgi:hypothetical protein